MKLKTLKFCLVMAGFTAASHGALSFSEDFSDNSASPNMALGGGYVSPISDTIGSFNITSGDGNRTYLGTNVADFGLQDFTFDAEVSFTGVSSAWSMVFFGMGNRNAGGAGVYGEPLTDAHLMMVIRPDEGGSGVLQTRNSTLASTTNFSGIGLTASSTHKLRMEWNAASNQATFLFDTGNNAGPGLFDYSYTSTVPAATFTGSNSQLFLGGGNGLKFDNIVVSTIPEPTAALLGGLGVLALLRRRRN